MIENFIKKNMYIHASLFFNTAGRELITTTKLLFIKLCEIEHIHEPCIVFPVDISPPDSSADLFQIKYKGIQYSLWGRVEKPKLGKWKAIPSDEKPLFYINDKNVVLLAWNFAGIAYDLLSFSYEKRTCTCDRHERVDEYSHPLAKSNILHTPFFNEGMVVVLFACSFLKTGDTTFKVDDYILPPVLMLSHDCDQLRGNDVYTQLSRIVRFIKPLFSFRAPKFKNIWWLIVNLLFPKKYFRDDLLAMIELEKQMGYRSTFYFLHGTRGRFGARSSLKDIKNFKKYMPENFGIGIHYNYDTLLNEDKFIRQKNQLSETMKPLQIEFGRAHYLRFNNDNSFDFLEEMGIKLDETVGFPDNSSYRLALAGVFKPLSKEKDRLLDLYEVPMSFMDSNIDVSTNGSYISMCRHLSKIGGLVSINFHPGNFNNPENSQLKGVYKKTLELAKELNFRCYLPGDVVKQLKNIADNQEV